MALLGAWARPGSKISGEHECGEEREVGLWACVCFLMEESLLSPLLFLVVSFLLTYN